MLSHGNRKNPCCSFDNIIKARLSLSSINHRCEGTLAYAVIPTNTCNSHSSADMNSIIKAIKVSRTISPQPHKPQFPCCITMHVGGCAKTQVRNWAGARPTQRVKPEKLCLTPQEGWRTTHPSHRSSPFLYSPPHSLVENMVFCDTVQNDKKCPM